VLTPAGKLVLITLENVPVVPSTSIFNKNKFHVHTATDSALTQANKLKENKSALQILLWPQD
jgi:hypothetical protein